MLLNEKSYRSYPEQIDDFLESLWDIESLSRVSSMANWERSSAIKTEGGRLPWLTLQEQAGHSLFLETQYK